MPFDPTELRKSDFPWTSETAYLDSASIGPVPTRSRATLDAFNALRATPHRIPKDVQFGALTRARELAARLLNASVAEIALATNTSFGLNIAARALPLGPGDIVLVSDREFPANVYPWMQLADHGVQLELVPVTPEGWPDEARLLERLSDPRVRVLAVSLVQFSNGYKVDLAALSKATRATGTWLVVDAIQGLGQFPVDLAETPVDILATGAQKWLLSPWGSGFFYVRKEILQQLTPPFAGWLAFQGTDDFNRLTEYNPAWHDDSRRFELITLPFQDFAAMNVSLEMILDIGVGEIAAHLRRVQEPLLDLAARRDIPITSPRGTHGCAIVCLRVPGAAKLHGVLRSSEVICSLREGSLRFSPHLFNSIDDVARAADVLEREMLKS
jgi:selenocysteine lyase/cysteine desulfurase